MGDLLAGALVALGVAFILMALSGQYGLLRELGIPLPGLETATQGQIKQGA